ncbi:putative inactive leucine-rich repeat receptor-like protein, partial [Drosera capensis]
SNYNHLNSQVLLQVRKHLEYPTHLEIWTNKETDVCYSSPTTRMNVACSGNVVFELRILGDEPSKNGDFVGYSIPNQTLSESFSMDSFVTTLARLGNLRDLSSNYLYGSIPPQIGRMVGLKTLALDGNFFSDSMPDWLESLSNLTTLSLANNQLKGRVPSSIGGMRSLVSLSLSNNEISRQLPDLSGLSSLTLLDLTSNKLDSFDGEIPKGYSQPSQLQNLDMSSNNLIKESCLRQSSRSLTLAFRRHNRLTGGLPGFLSKKVAKFAGNCLTVDASHQHPGSYCIGSGHMKSEKSKSGGLLVSIGVIGGTMLILALLHLLNKQVHENPVARVTPELMTNARFISQAVKSATRGIPTCRVFSIEELNEVTNNFDQSVLIGESARGKVYKGILQNGTPVATRCLALSSKYTIRNFKLRLDLLAKLRHPHLVCLLCH